MANACNLTANFVEMTWMADRSRFFRKLSIWTV